MRTKEEFDRWFRESGGDPWNTTSWFVQNRHDASLRFIQMHVPPAFPGVIIEAGAFDGAFTARLAQAFCAARILATDISDVALDKARATAGHLGNVRFRQSDIGDLQPVEGASILILMEVLYYLEPGERLTALSKALAATKPGICFISAPVQDPVRYFSEDSLAELLRECGYERFAHKVLNHTDAFEEIIGEPLRRRLRLDLGAQGSVFRKCAYHMGRIIFHLIRGTMFWRLEHEGNVRKRYARQVIYAFRPRR